ncbi:hypothetical protein B0H21DRAFT_764038 [Amylocystis lapponica]|nr:hypothetical protein B0H21DRAFT_764038 [Amylocystis lapponica]
MRESNFAFPALNRACVCISSQLYDRRALDTNSPLPLFNSLTHLTYLTSTSPRIREIMTMDGGLERLVRIIHDFCMCPPPPENPLVFYGLSPPSAHPPKPTPTLIPKSVDKHAAHHFALALQCVVNIGVRGSEPIRSRVVQAGTLDVVGCVLEAWLAGKGFPVGPSFSMNGMPRETREQRYARRQAQSLMRQREQAAELQRVLEVERVIRDERVATGREVFGQEDEPMDTDQAVSGGPRQPGSGQDTDTSTDTSSNSTPLRTNTPTGTVVVPSRDRSGTIIGRFVWDQAPEATTTPGTLHHRRPHRTRTVSQVASASTSATNSRPETETEDDGDVDMDRESSREGDPPSISGSPSPERQESSDTATVRASAMRSRRAVGIVSDTTTNTATGASLDINSDAHIIINDQGVVVDGVGVEDGIVSLEPNDDFAMGAPPGAPGAIDGTHARITDTHGATAGERTPRAGTANLPLTIPITVPPVPTTAVRVTGGTPIDGRPIAGFTRTHTNRGLNTTAPTGTTNGGGGPVLGAHLHHHFRDVDSGPYRDQDVLLSLQLLAYLSKYPHVRQAFYKPRSSFHPASAQEPIAAGRLAQTPAGPSGPPNSSRFYTVVVKGTTTPSSPGSTAVPAKEPNSFMKALATATGRGKEKEKVPVSAAAAEGSSTAQAAALSPPRMTNVFALVERFTYRHSSSDVDPNTPPPFRPEIQYWAGVIMRNACRKDDSRGGIRQCANMLCGRWESYPREFAKCRRCRKAKYCGKECQSTAWSEGHRFWCSAKDPEEDAEHHHGQHAVGPSTIPSSQTGTAAAAAATTTTAGGTVTGRAERRAERERERQARAEARFAEHTGARTAAAFRTNPLARSDANATLATLNAPPTPTGSTEHQTDFNDSPGRSHWSHSLLGARRQRGRDDDTDTSVDGETSAGASGVTLLSPASRRDNVNVVEADDGLDRGEGPSTGLFPGMGPEDVGVDDMLLG